MLSEQRILDIFSTTGVMLEGHFKLTSGRHSDKYMQFARLFEYPEYSQMLCAELASRFTDVDIVAGPALGGIIMAYEVSRALGARNVFAEREDGVLTLRRGFEIPKDANVLCVEDVVTTGGSVKELLGILHICGANPVGVAAIVDRSGGQVDFGVRFESVYRAVITSYPEDKCPLCEQGIPVVKPGSRVIQ